MLKRIKLTFITLGLACGMTAGALAYLHNVKTCRVMVLNDLHSNAEFKIQLSNYAETKDFLTALTKGVK